MKTSMRGAVDPYGISLVLVIVSSFFFNAKMDEKLAQQEYSESQSDNNDSIAQKQ